MSEVIEDLPILAAQTELLLGTVGRLPDTSSATLCEGWTRGHVLTHIARNAEAIGRLAQWANTGVPQEMYPGGTQARDAQVEAGAGRPLPVLLDDVTRTARALQPQLDALTGALAATEVELRGGLRTSPEELPFLRLREVVYHHVDLDAGFGFDDVPEDLVRRFIGDAVGRLRLGSHPPPLDLRTSDGERWTVGEPTAYVTGSPAGILVWLARRIPDGVQAEGGELPRLPRGA